MPPRPHPLWPRTAGLMLALLAGFAPPHAQAQAAADTSFVQLNLTSCGVTLLRGQGTLDQDCPYVQGPLTLGGTGANGSNLWGVLRGNTSAAVNAVNLTAESRSQWDERFTFQGGTVPASVVFRYQLFGFFNANVSGPSAAGGEALFRAFIRPFGSWGGVGSDAVGTLEARQFLQSTGEQLQNDYQAVLGSVALPISLAGIAVGNSLDFSTSFTLRSWASANNGGLADALASFSNSAGLVGLQFFNAQGADITPEVQWSWTYGTQFLAPVPEAPGAWLLAAGLAGLLWRLRGRRPA